MVKEFLIVNDFSPYKNSTYFPFSKHLFPVCKEADQKNILYLFHSLHPFYSNCSQYTMKYRYINTEYLDSVSGGDDSIMLEIINMFREQAVEMHNEMKMLLAEKNYVNLGLLAHKAKSSVAIMGMTDLAGMLKTFELQAKEGKEPGQYESWVNRFGNDTA